MLRYSARHKTFFEYFSCRVCSLLVVIFYIRRSFHPCRHNIHSNGTSKMRAFLIIVVSLLLSLYSSFSCFFLQPGLSFVLLLSSLLAAFLFLSSFLFLSFSSSLALSLSSAVSSRTLFVVCSIVLFFNDSFSFTNANSTHAA